MINAFADKCMAGIQVYNAFLNVVIFCTQMDFDQALIINAFVFLTLYGIILKKNVWLIVAQFLTLFLLSVVVLISARVNKILSGNF